MLWMLANIALGGAHTHQVLAHVESAAEPGHYLALVSRDGGPPMVMAGDGGAVAFECDALNTPKYREKAISAYLLFLSGVKASIGTDATYDPAKSGAWGFMGSEADGYCNMTASTHGGVAVIAVRYNDRCFGSAGCVRQEVTLTGDADFIDALSTVLRAGLATK